MSGQIERSSAAPATPVGVQPLDADLTAIAALTPSNDDVIQRKSGAWDNRSMAQLRTDIYANGQIAFPASQNASADANTLDDYEEGTFTPAFSATGCTFNYLTRFGDYRKVGSLVVVNLALVLNSSGNTLAANPLSITGLPFQNNGNNTYSRINWLQSTTSYVDMMGVLDSGASSITVRGTTAAATGNLNAINASAALHATNQSIITATWAYTT